MGEGPVELSGERVRLRALTPAETARLGSDPAAFAAGLGLGSAPEWPSTVVRERFREGIPEIAADPRFGVWVVIEVAARTLIGDVGFHGPPDAHGSLEIGYALAPEWRGRGYATEAVGLLCAWAEAREGVTGLTARTDPDNAASARVLERVGFVAIGAAEGYRLWRRG
ncbi:MAG: GNAT family N-acetyltransferase [Acidimicrobiales bacterium]